MSDWRRGLCSLAHIRPTLTPMPTRALPYSSLAHHRRYKEAQIHGPLALAPRDVVRIVAPANLPAGRLGELREIAKIKGVGFDTYEAGRGPATPAAHTAAGAAVGVPPAAVPCPFGIPAPPVPWHGAASESGVRLARKMQAGPCVSCGNTAIKGCSRSHFWADTAPFSL